MEFDYTTDVLVVGSGSGGLVAALAAADAGSQVIVLESSSLVGGSSAMSGGGMWIPNNHLMRAAGVDDSYEEARAYIDAIIGDVGPASSAARRDAYLRQGPEMVRWLSGLGFRFLYGRGYPDYYPELRGGSEVGRCLEGETFDMRRLGPWATKVRNDSPLQFPIPMPLHTPEASKFALAARTWSGFATAAKVIAGRSLGWVIRGRRPVATGGSLIGQLLLLALQRSIPVWLDCPLVELITSDGEVVGAVARHDGRTLRIGARKGVVLAAGGFAKNHEMREKYLPAPASTEWTVASPADLGDAVRAGIDVGAAVALMDDAWWGPVFIDQNGAANFMLWERSEPHGFIVDTAGQRFMNESASYVDCGHAQYTRNLSVPAIPAYLVMDARHRRYYPFGGMLPRMTPKSAFSSGFFVRADTLGELARKCGIDSAGLARTAVRFNEFARTGVDEDFHRGDSAYDRFYGDPRVKPNNNLGAVEKGPFYATTVWPGDLGTKGGLLTDEHARVLREDGSPIVGLYGTGNTTASVMGRTYPGPGATIGPATTFGMIAGRHAAARS